MKPRSFNNTCWMVMNYPVGWVAGSVVPMCQMFEKGDGRDLKVFSFCIGRYGVGFIRLDPSIRSIVPKRKKKPYAYPSPLWVLIPMALCVWAMVNDSLWWATGSLAEAFLIWSAVMAMAEDHQDTQYLKRRES